MCLRDQIFRFLLEHFISEVVRKWQRDQILKVLLVHFFYKFCEQGTTGANVWRFLVYHIIDFVQKLLRKKQLLYFF